MRAPDPCTADGGLTALGVVQQVDFTAGPVEYIERLGLEAAQGMQFLLFIRFADPALKEGGIDLAAQEQLEILDRA